MPGSLETLALGDSAVDLLYDLGRRIASDTADTVLLLQARLPGTHCQTISVIRRLAKTLLGDY